MTTAHPKLHPVEVAAALRDVTVTYDGYKTRALNHADAEFRRGEVTAVLGEKGAGKSTLLRVLAGQLNPAEGSVKVLGRSPRGGVKSRIGFLPGKKDANRPPGIVDRLLGTRRKSSSGARGVARLAQAMVGNRDLVVLDDPFADLSPAEIAEAKALIRDLVARGKTVVLGSEAFMEVADISSRFVILHEGRVQAAGTLSELLGGAGALRFLPAVLPSEMVERILAVLRDEIASRTALPQTQTAERVHPSPKRETLAPASSKPAKLKPGDAIDHEKLEGLMKPPTPD